MYKGPVLWTLDGPFSPYGGGPRPSSTRNKFLRRSPLNNKILCLNWKPLSLSVASEANTSLSFMFSGSSDLSHLSPTPMAFTVVLSLGDVINENERWILQLLARHHHLDMTRGRKVITKFSFLNVSHVFSFCWWHFHPLLPTLKMIVIFDSPFSTNLSVFWRLLILPSIFISTSLISGFHYLFICTAAQVKTTRWLSQSSCVIDSEWLQLLSTWHNPDSSSYTNSSISTSLPTMASKTSLLSQTQLLFFAHISLDHASSVLLFHCPVAILWAYAL